MLFEDRKCKCPNCGGVALYVDTTTYDFPKHNSAFYVECPNCKTGWHNQEPTEYNGDDDFVEVLRERLKEAV